MQFIGIVSKNILIKISIKQAQTIRVSNIFINLEQNSTNPIEINLKTISITKNTVKISLIFEITGFSTKPSKHNNNTLNNTIPSNIVSTPLFLNN